MIKLINFYKKLYVFCYKSIWKLVYAKHFKFFGKNVSILFPKQIIGFKSISIGSNNVFLNGIWLYALDENSSLSIENNCYIGYNAHIVSKVKVLIESDVLIANNVYISDNYHGYENIEIPIKSQPIFTKKSTIVGSGTWLGENVVVISSHIGKNCVIGANSVVTKDIPDYCVAVGTPAKIIKKYDEKSQKWKKTNNKGKFIDEI